MDAPRVSGIRRLVREEPMRDGYVAADVEIAGFRVVQRVCATCWDQAVSL